MQFKAIFVVVAAFVLGAAAIPAIGQNIDERQCLYVFILFYGRQTC